MGTGWSEDVHWEPESVKRGHCSQCATIECAKFRPLACELAPPAADALTGGGGAALAASTKTSASGLLGGVSAAAEDGTPRRSAALMARSCKAAGV